MTKSKSLPIVYVKENNQLLNELTELAKTVAGGWLKTRNPNLYNIAMAAMIVIEKYTKEIGKLSSEDKLKAAIQLIPVIINLLKEASAITEEDANKYMGMYTSNQAIIEQFINIAVEISNHPDIINAGLYVKEKVTGCFNKCLPSCKPTQLP